ncbi:fucolectin-1-like [Leucoraja erinacea]|uniref:fucolectin-1-like n=1 Tax=Leucoraja erinaceus TaxID=7782 RepID=UPI00245874FE|nr:fucolectin-1-like [Leucoraja erinacea]
MSTLFLLFPPISLESVIPESYSLLSLKCILPFGSVRCSLSTGNVAGGASPTQSSTEEGAGAEGAIDGNSDSDFWKGSCARTRKSKDPWWRVDLKSSNYVTDVRITNRADCCSDQLLGAELRIGDSLENDGNSNRLCGTVVSVALTTIIFNCDGFIGRYVNIFLPGQDKILTLCEVEVFTSILPTIDTLLKPKPYPPSAHEREKLTTTNTPSLKGTKQPPSFGKETTPQSTKGTKIPSIPGTTIQPRTGKKRYVAIGSESTIGNWNR